ncbi:GbsR/MarR family transcriptional regulator [Algisphaera agarilytica]|uniref:HTH-type transcriptional regulator n=1 Tax=Algisphaera agarilytica TaxID=1385975 RepID=A0A7X0LK44_9BACT|nr:MarR family transcriptional regulator [Algisphaera agarilytica]MBB6430050.1 DNA-binding transcriptional regulator GbsR (MarR family) [Algisphaera agarilytica]
MKLSAVQQKFILHWGEMGTRWGVNRTVAQVHALLYLADRPLNADDLVETLGVARSNISTSLKELQGWGIVHTAPVLGERRDHFITTADVWEMFQIILDERKKREIDPTLAILRECVEEAEAAESESDHTRRRLRELHGLIDDLAQWYTQIRALPTGAVIKFVKMGSKVRKVLGLTG